MQEIDETCGGFPKRASNSPFQYRSSSGHCGLTPVLASYNSAVV
ncbi:hypothetical protein SLEP1_g52507 [Rubroshorea leprosula]|uniref:Uncharacterized protein n=1 Tax=Rubroshorea leprosula TaxID=152421 RepID=A0AAV5M8S8_9ROSI|nr:hypothetical protein SLEP1_g52507 [Rubroshorea leprosula]